MTGLHEISHQHLMRQIASPDCPCLIDVCSQEDFAADPNLIPGTKRWDEIDIDGLVSYLGSRPAVVICQKGLKLSHGVAARLRHRGLTAQVLTGGHFAWRDAGLPRIPAKEIPGPIWVTRHRPKIDRIASPWLIKRFVDPDAEFLFVPPSQVNAVAEKFGGTAFDVEGARFCHVGDRCSFDKMVSVFSLAHPALEKLAELVRAADMAKHERVAEAAGLHAISVGLSRLHKDDNSQLDAGLSIYDALYRWARDGQGEIHDH